MPFRRYRRALVLACIAAIALGRGAAQVVDEMDMAATDYRGDYARGYQVQVSSNGSAWTTVATCTGTGVEQFKMY